MSDRAAFWPHGNLEASPLQFAKQQLPFTLTLNALLCLPIAALTGASLPSLRNAFVFSQCVGLSILLLFAVTYVGALRRFTPHPMALAAAYVLLTPLGMVLGLAAGSSLLATRGPSLAELLSDDWLLWLAFSFLGSAVALLYRIGGVLVRERERRADAAERAALEAQLRALQAQIEPHFLFNTLATLDALIGSDDAHARKLLAHLNHYLRAALAHSRSAGATLRTEIDLLKAYLSIMTLRLPQRLDAQFDCDPDCMDLLFPPMLLQPLVENAITHGIEPSREGGLIRVSARRSAATLTLSVEDSGVGLGASAVTGAGAALDNVRARLRSSFGDRATFAIGPREPRGTCASICVPLEALTGPRA